MTLEGEPPPQSSLIGVTSTPEHQRVAPGEQAIYALTIENRSEEAQAQSLELRGLPDEWYTIDFDERRKSFPGEQRSATLIVSVPEDAAPDRHEFRVVAKAGAEESALRCSLEVLAPAVGAPPPAEPEPEAAPPRPSVPVVTLSPTQASWQGEPGEEERLTLSVRNVGSSETEYVVSLEGLTAGWYTLPPRLRVPPGEALDAELRIHPPARARTGDYPFKVRVAVDQAPNIAAEAQGRLTVPPPAPAPPRRAAPPPPTEPAPPPPAAPALPPEVSLAPRTTFRFGPGVVSEQAILTVQNKSRLIERYEIQVQGLPEEWSSLGTTELRLDPGASQQVPLRFTPRPGPGRPAGEYAFRVRVAPHRFPDSFAEVGGLLTITGVAAFDARIAPTQAQGRKELFKLTLTNTGSVPLNLWLEGSDPEGMCKFRSPPPPNLDPGQEAVVPVWVGIRRNGLIGPPETYDFRLRVLPAGAESTAAKSFDGRFVHQPFLTLRFAFLSFFLALLATAMGVGISLGTPRFEAFGTWVGCRIDQDFPLAPGSRQQLVKPECDGGAPLAQCQQAGYSRSECEALLADRLEASPTPAATPRATQAPPLGCTPSQDFQSGARVTVVFNAPDATIMRRDPGTGGAQVKRVTQNTPATVVEGQHGCADNLVWWKIRLDGDGVEGWVAERAPDGDILLQPQ